MRPRLCWFCHEPATVEDQRQRRVAVIRLDGTVDRRHEWTGRYLCPVHEHLDPWE